MNYYIASLVLLPRLCLSFSSCRELYLRARALRNQTHIAEPDERNVELNSYVVTRDIFSESLDEGQRSTSLLRIKQEY